MEHNIVTERNSSLYYGIKKLWRSEVEFWRTATKPEYYLYEVPNSEYQRTEYYLVENPSDLETLKQYLKDGNRLNDYKYKVEVRKKGD